MNLEKNPKEEKTTDNETIGVTSYVFNPKHTVQDLAKHLQVSNIFLIKKILEMGVKTNINQTLDRETIELLGLELNLQIIYSPQVDPDHKKGKSKKENTKLTKRVPIVTIMGHVDHGKTTLLDSIRQTRVVDQEFGGITQHIGAYEISYNNNKITFIDSPGHEAFSQMRSRGAKVTDICVLVVACDDGVKPQTIESVEHAKAANVDIIVVINKIDKLNNKKENIMTELSNYGLLPEEWGGNTPYIEMSALKKQGLNNLLEMILLMSDIKNIQTDLTKKAEGTVLEASLVKNKGPLATLILTNGILKIGDVVVVGETYGKIRSIEDDLKKSFKQAVPSQPVVVSGLKQVPQAGDHFMLVENEKVAKRIADERKHLAKAKKYALLDEIAAYNDNVFELEDENETKTLNIILKTDTQGSIEAIQKALGQMSTEEVKINFIKNSVGMVTINDINLAKTFEALLINFNTPLNNDLLKFAQDSKVEIKTYQILYKMMEDIEIELKKLIKPVFEEKMMGQAEVRKIFYISSIGHVAGCYVTSGTIFNNSLAKVIRNKEVIYEGKITSLKHLKNNINSAKQGHECGIVLDNFNTFQVDDIIESSKMEKVV
ncbi:translation initiation factor IF-2 [Vaccinium witches'-broom phytoplasma]|uniref:translation initiation factor IF-2 n=1 Tax=Vaccinium witches'-broom phytoplasma TaxID=85642 RepID=UPI000361403C|nr:translation initiation factor IF-2 [Vaccinium witches'-broom phytoplasma]